MDVRVAVTVLAKMSVVPPAVKATTTLTGFWGYGCACAQDGINMATVQKLVNSQRDGEDIRVFRSGFKSKGIQVL